MSRLKRTVIAGLKARIELEASCTVTLQEDTCPDTGELLGWFAWANRDSEYREGSRTVGTAWAMFPIEALDRLAASLGVAVDEDAPAVVRSAA